MNEKIYIHELIDIVGQNRARYMHHMTANWVPVAIAERNQYCFGVWGTVGSTGSWPQVVNIWELDGWKGLAANFEHELSHPSLQDPALAEWWATASTLRRGGLDRILVPEPWSPTVAELIEQRVRGVVYAHELFALRASRSRPLLDDVGAIGRKSVEALGLRLVGAFNVAMACDTEAVVIWAIPNWPAWVSYERAWDPGGALERWRRAVLGHGASFRRTLMVEAPLSPLRIGRQPGPQDRRPLEEV